MKPERRTRWTYAALAVLVLLLGLASRRYAAWLPLAVRKNTGDSLWALMVFCLVGGLFPRRSAAWTAGVAMTFSVCIECSQLYHASWIDTVRSYTMGHLVLGSGFAWRDMAAYAVGIAVGATIEWTVAAIRRRDDRPEAA